MSDRPSLFRSTLMLTGVGLLSQIFGFVYRVVMARLAGAEVLGLYQLVMPAYAVAQSICISGLAVAVSVLSSEYNARKNASALRRLMAASLRGLVALWLPVALTVLTWSGFISRVLLGDARTRTGLLLLLPVLLLTGVENLQKQHFYGLGVMRLPAGVELGEQLLRSLSIILLLLWLAPEREEVSVALIVTGMLISELFSSSALTLGRKRHSLPADNSPPIQAAALRRRLIGIALPVSLTALAGNLMSAATSVLIPKLLVAYGLSAGEAMESFGILLGMTLPLLMTPTAFLNALCLALLPRLTEEREMGRLAALRRTVEKAMLSVSYVILPLIALIATLGPVLGALLFHEERAGRFMLPLAVGVGASCYHAVLRCTLNALGRQRHAAAISLACGGLELALTVALTGRLALAGFVTGFVVSEVLAMLLCLVMVWRFAGVRVSCWRCFSAPVLASLLAGLLVNLAWRYSLDAGTGRYWALLWCGLGGLVVYAAAMLAQGIRPLESIRMQ